MHYELDWSYRLRADVTCENATAEKVCFATTACLCSNGYYQIAQTMPARTAEDEYDGFTEVLEEYERVEELKKEEGDVTIDKDGVIVPTPPKKTTSDGDDEDEGMFGMETWLLIVTLCALVVILTIVGVGIFYMMKRCNKRKSGTDQTTIKPYDPNNIEMGSNKNRAKIGDIGMAAQESA